MYAGNRVLFTCVAALLAWSSYGMENKCKAGSFLSRGSCKLCPRGTYQNREGASNCKKCPAGYFNQYKGAQGIDLCDPCKAGTFSKTRGATSKSVCKPCPRGKDSLDGSSRCVSCPAGTVISNCPLMQEFDATLIPGMCLACSFGFGSTGGAGCVRERAELKCRKCPEGYFSSKRNSKECSKCDVTKISTPGSSKCFTCPPGKGDGRFREGTGNKVCSACTEYQFNDGKDGTCRGCPPGTQGNAKTGSVKCVPCPVGTFNPDVFGQCRSCKPGENSSATGASSCVQDKNPCPKNFFRNFRGACQKCTKRQRYNKSKKRCEDCGKDEASKGGLATKCTKCPPGSVGFVSIEDRGVSEGDLGCVCTERLLRMKDGQCGPCPPGTIKQFEDSITCDNCEPGFFAPKAGMTKCLKCPLGTAQEISGQSNCIRCPKGLKPGFESRCVDPTTNCVPTAKRVKGLFSMFGIHACQGPPRQCSTSEFYDPKQNACVFCGDDSISEGGRATKCKRCGKESLTFAQVFVPGRC